MQGKIKSGFYLQIRNCLEEADESILARSNKEAILSKDTDGIDPLIKEANELVSIFNAADITAKKNRNNQSNYQITKSQNQK